MAGVDEQSLDQFERERERERSKLGSNEEPRAIGDGNVLACHGQRSLSLYPNGNEHDNGAKHISLYLSIEERDKLSNGRKDWKVDVNFKLFVYDQKRHEYLTIPDAAGKVSSFDSSKTRWGFPRFLSLKKFKDPSNGYLSPRDQSCTFGAEVFVIRPWEESFTLIRNPDNNTRRWSFTNWSQLGAHCYSDEFEIGKRKWKLLVYPNGIAARKGKSLSVYLEVQRLTGKMQVYAEFHLRVLDQLKHNNKEEKIECWLSASDPKGGKADFMPSKDLQKKAKGFVCSDTLMVEVQIHAVSAKQSLKLVGAP
ncbi:uncharacterized protein LOC120293911 [Eucalyptus grandis]|uniref:uncharacterized protein LOC120293911 n=1 Tax=Eucalyptus grandis TaxID=71139 RepID=UPI00192EB241|nr:uncharacterized protein LOC120293911 [Eucalyptus grandis]